jgi:hypothetical protein
MFFKSVNLFNRFKKCKFLAPKGGNQKNLLYKGRIKRKKIIGGKNKTRPHYRGVSTYLPYFLWQIDSKTHEHTLPISTYAWLFFLMRLTPKTKIITRHPYMSETPNFYAQRFYWYNISLSESSNYYMKSWKYRTLMS